MSMQNYLDEFENNSEAELRMVGLMHAIQTLSFVLIDTPEKRSRLAKVVDGLAEMAYDAKLSEAQKDAYLRGLSALSQAATMPG